MTKFYQVGGSVRDKFLDVKSKDIDYAVEAQSFDAMREAILARGGKIFLETPQYFTIRAMVPILGATDYTLCRKDGTYKDGRHPESVTIGSIQDDLARRDFTMNAIAIDTDTGTVIDPFNGRAHIEVRLIKCVGDAKQRFKEDELRVFRALRFCLTKGFDIHPLTCIAMKEVSSFDGVSTERIREELLKMFTADSWKSFDKLVNDFPNMARVIKERNIWFKPTESK